MSIDKNLSKNFEENDSKNFNRRRFVSLLAALPGVGLLVACGDSLSQATSPAAVGGAAAAPTAASLTTSNATTAAMLTDSTTTAANSATTAAMTTQAAVSNATTVPTNPTAVPATTVEARKTANLPNRGPAPDFSNTNWINSAPLKLADLRGKVVMMEFWTFSCYNCQNVIPSLRDLYADFSDKGFTIVSMHAPEFEYEKKWENVQEAVKKAGIKYPVAQDNDFVTWGKYHINAWPTLVLVDKVGNIRYQHIGEGAYEETRVAVQALLAE